MHPHILLYRPPTTMGVVRLTSWSDRKVRLGRSTEPIRPTHASQARWMMAWLSDPAAPILS